MKGFIVFMAFLLIFASAMVYATDSNNYVRLQKHLKALAEECASGAILMKDEDETNRQNRYVINMEAAEAYVNQLTGRVANITASAITYPAFGISDAAVKVTVNWSGPDIFRLPFISVTNVSSFSVYEAKFSGGR